jgi:hypothetical protein
MMPNQTMASVAVVIFGAFLIGLDGLDRISCGRPIPLHHLERLHGAGPGFGGIFPVTCDENAAMDLGAGYVTEAGCHIAGPGTLCVACDVTSGNGERASGWTSVSGYVNPMPAADCGQSYRGVCDIDDLCLGGIDGTCSDLDTYLHQSSGPGG